MKKIQNKQDYIQMYNEVQEGQYKKIKIFVSNLRYNNFTSKMYQDRTFEGFILNVTPFHFILKVDSKEVIIRIREIREYEFINKGK